MGLLLVMLAGCAGIHLPGRGLPPAEEQLPTLPAAEAEAMQVQVWLSRTPYQPGAIDGKTGSNTRIALTAFQRAHALAPTGQPDAPTLAALGAAADAKDRPLTTRYELTADDVAGPFTKIPEGLYDAHSLSCMCYRSVWEKLAERFQMTPALLQELNPAENVDAVAAGDILVVPDPAPVVPLVAPVAKIRIEVDVRTLTALDTEGHLLRQYPTVVGETFAGYRGELTVAGITYDPSYRMDPETWKELPASWPAVTIPPGPNSPVGLVWMQLSREGYGIHGTGDPETIGHTESHGCVRLTNWSALELAAHVQPGVTRVDFVGLGRG